MTTALELKKTELERRAIGAYLGLAVGDALGATVEFMTPGEIKAQHGVHADITGGGWLYLKPGNVTDDTEMSLSLGKALLDHGPDDLEAIATAFSDWMRTKPVDIGNTVRRGIMDFRASGSPHVHQHPEIAGNGACMRTLPVALLGLGESPVRLVEMSCNQAHVTHHNEMSDAGTMCVIQMVQKGLSGDADIMAPAHELAGLKKDYAFTGREMVNPSGYIVETLLAVFQALDAAQGFEDVLVNVVNRGGDADTTGAIAGMIAGSINGPEAIPARWLDVMNPDVIRDCEDQAVALIRRSSAYHQAS